jgi:hypothetical protein
MAFNLDGIDATTLARINKKFTDNLSTKTPFFFKMKERDGIDLVNGGKELTYPVILGNGIAGSYYGDDVLDIARPSGIQPLKFYWKQFFSSVRIDGIEEIMNAGEGEGAKLLDGRMQQSEITTAEAFETMLFGDGTGNVGGDGVARDWWGLQALIADDPSTGTIGEQSRATYASLRNQTYTTAITTFNTSQAGVIAMTRLWTDCINGSRQPNFIPTTATIWGLYHAALTYNERFVDSYKDKGLKDIGMPSLGFMEAPVVISRACKAAHLYMVRIAKGKTTGGVSLVISSQKNFKMGEFRKPVDQDIRVALVLSAGQLVNDAPYLSGVMTNITA